MPRPSENRWHGWGRRAFGALMMVGAASLLVAGITDRPSDDASNRSRARRLDSDRADARLLPSPPGSPGSSGSSAWRAGGGSVPFEPAPGGTGALAEAGGDPLIVPPASGQDDELDRDEVRWFDGRPIRPARVLRMKVTAYSPDERSCGRFADGVTASGYSVWTNGMSLAAADTRVLPFGSLISVPGYDGGAVIPVLDRGGRIKGQRLDLLYGSHDRALRWGVQDLLVTVWEYADGNPSGFRVRH